MAVKFNVSEARINATIELTDLTEETYRDIVAFINARTSGAPEKNAAAAESKPATPMPADDVPKTTITTQKRSRLSEKLEALVNDQQKNPDGYEMVPMSCHDWLAAHPEDAEFSSRAIGCTMSKYLQEAQTIYGKSPAGYSAIIRRWFVPVPVRKSNPMGDAIRAGRKENRITVKELAELIEYPADVVKKWESGEYTPSCDGLAAMKLVLGEKWFEDLK